MHRALGRTKIIHIFFKKCESREIVEAIRLLEAVETVSHFLILYSPSCALNDFVMAKF